MAWYWYGIPAWFPSIRGTRSHRLREHARNLKTGNHVRLDSELLGLHRQHGGSRPVMTLRLLRTYVDAGGLHGDQG
jgi:hypothetical protein